MAKRGDVFGGGEAPVSKHLPHVMLDEAKAGAIYDSTALSRSLDMRRS